MSILYYVPCCASPNEAGVKYMVKLRRVPKMQRSKPWQQGFVAHGTVSLEWYAAAVHSNKLHRPLHFPVEPGQGG